MRWLVEGARSGDTLFFYCKNLYWPAFNFPHVKINLVSGHATRVKATNGDERRGSGKCLL
jgi:hypothetical protein